MGRVERRRRGNRLEIALGILLVLSLGACNKTWAPVEDRSSSRSEYQMTPDGYYRVRRGDSLHAIAFNFGLDWREIARWNGIGAPYVIHPGQELSLSPAPPRAKVTTSAAGPRPSVSERTAETSSAPAKTAPASQSPAQEPVKPPSTTPRKSSSGGKTASTADPSSWLWPVEGRLLSTFKAGDPARNGIEIAGKEGQAVRAAAAGEVVYSGSGLIGYGELIIVKHSERILSAYAHNRKRLVAEGQAVSAGERIAEMGRDDRNRAMLHFEIRRDGTPQDPLGFLPKR